MGKGDKRSKRGKIWRGTSGKTRQKRKRTPGKKLASARLSSPKSK